MKVAALPAAVLVACITSQGVLAQESDERCNALAEAATVKVVFEDAPITWDTRHRPEEIERMHRSAPQANHLVLGMTTARPTVRMSVAHRSLVTASGRVCVVGSVVLTLGFSDLRVYLASTLDGPCRRRIVEQHELEHVRIWRSHLRAGARMIEPVLQKQLAAPLFVDSVDQAEPTMKQHLMDLVTPLVQQLTSVVDTAQRELDTPESYRSASARFRACP